jgi:hypothetical protein
MTFESNLTMMLWVARAFILRILSSGALYSVVLLLLGSGLMKFIQAAYLILAPEGDPMMADIPTPSLPYAPSQHMTHGSIGASSLKLGDV